MMTVRDLKNDSDTLCKALNEKEEGLKLDLNGEYEDLIRLIGWQYRFNFRGGDVELKLNPKVKLL
jgi:hypothetical protein